MCLTGKTAVILALLPWFCQLHGYELNMCYALHKTILLLSNFFAQTMNKFIGLCPLSMKIQSLGITFCLPEPDLFPAHLRTFHNCGYGINRRRKKPPKPITVKISTNKIESWE